MHNSERNELQSAVEEKMRKMFFSQPVINRYFETASFADIEKMNCLLDDYDFSGIKFPKNFTQEDMLSLDFIEKKHTIVFFGGCGSGKTHATTALGIEACNRDYKVKFFTLTSLVMHLKNAKNNGTLERAYKNLMNCNLICIDEWGYLPLDLESGQLLFSVISNAYERLSLIITTNLPFNEWGPLFADEQLAAAIIDRIVHYGHLINTGVKDWRLTHALMNDR